MNDQEHHRSTEEYHEVSIDSVDPAERLSEAATPEQRQEIPFTDAEGHDLFHLPDGENLVITLFGGDTITRPCVFRDNTHFFMGSSVHNVREFANVMARTGCTFRPEHPREGDICDTYDIYQMKDTCLADYKFMSYGYAAGKIHPEHYDLAYSGILAPETVLDDIYRKHNMDDRPFGQTMRSLSISDVVVLNRDGKWQAFYVDRIGFAECREFLKRSDRTRKPRKRKRPER